MLPRVYNHKVNCFRGTAGDAGEPFVPSSEDEQDDMMQGHAAIDPITCSGVIEGVVPLCVQARGVQKSGNIFLITLL